MAVKDYLWLPLTGGPADIAFVTACELMDVLSVPLWHACQRFNGCLSALTAATRWDESKPPFSGNAGNRHSEYENLKVRCVMSVDFHGETLTSGGPRVLSSPLLSCQWATWWIYIKTQASISIHFVWRQQPILQGCDWSLFIRHKTL